MNGTLIQNYLWTFFREKFNHVRIRKIQLYNKLLLEYGKAYATKKYEVVQKEVEELWDKLKSDNMNIEDVSQACAWEFEKLRRMELKGKDLLFSMWEEQAKLREDDL